MVETNCGVKLVEYLVSPLQRAFLEYNKDNPYITYDKLKIHEGVPLEGQVITEFGIITVRFDKIAKEKGYI